MTQPDKYGTEITHMARVDADDRAHRPTEPNEEQVLRELYGDPDSDGIFRGEGE